MLNSRHGSSRQHRIRGKNISSQLLNRVTFQNVACCLWVPYCLSSSGVQHGYHQGDSNKSKFRT